MERKLCVQERHRDAYAIFILCEKRCAKQQKHSWSAELFSPINPGQMLSRYNQFTVSLTFLSLTVGKRM